MFHNRIHLIFMTFVDSQCIQLRTRGYYNVILLVLLQIVTIVQLAELVLNRAINLLEISAYDKPIWQIIKCYSVFRCLLVQYCKMNETM